MRFPEYRKTSREHVPTWLLALICLSGTLAMHIFVPALPAAAADLAASPKKMQMTISLYFLGLSVGQLIYGPLSDRYGRRPILLLGLTIYTASGFVAFVANDVDTLIISRLFQALGGCVGLVVSRAIVHDTSPDDSGARRLATMNLIITIGPGVAPIVGSTLTNFLDWRSVLAILWALGLLNLALTIFLVPETGPKTSSSGARNILRNYMDLVGMGPFMALAIGGGLATAAMYAFTVNAPFIIEKQLNEPTNIVGIALALAIFGIWIGNVAATAIVGRINPIKALCFISLISTVTTASFFFISVTSYFAIWPMMAAVMGCTFCVGIAHPFVLALALSQSGGAAGSAAGLFGSLQMFIGMLCSALAGFGSNPAISSALIMFSCSLGALVCFWIVSHKT